MKRFIASAAAAAMLVAGTGQEAQAQARASLFDLGVYGGAGYDWNWLRDPQVNPGFAPVVGAHATFWTSPGVGVRANVAYHAITLPDNARPNDVNGWFYDLNLVLRPWFAAGPQNLMGSSYIFLGGGAFTANPPGQGLACVEPYRSQNGACLAVDWRKSTVGQGTAGFGWDLVSLTNNIGFFTELGANVYSSPFHTGPGWAPPAGANQAEDPWAVSARLVAGLKLAFGDILPVAAPLPPPPPPPAPAPAPAPATREITVCVIQDGQIRNMTATFNPATNDTMVAGQRFRDAHAATAPTYAAGVNWYVTTDQMRFNNRDYVRFGVSRLITTPAQLTRVGEFQGTPIFAEAGATAPYQVLYVPLRPGCEFQPYQLRTAIQPRG
ncbi:hypothetical protein BH23GEM6_BH23GEM6_25050 [soil metagenome]